MTRLLVSVLVVFHDCGIHRNNTKTIRNTSNKFIMIEDPIRRQRQSQDFSKGVEGHIVSNRVYLPDFHVDLQAVFYLIRQKKANKGKVTSGPGPSPLATSISKKDQRVNPRSTRKKKFLTIQKRTRTLDLQMRIQPVCQTTTCLNCLKRISSSS